MKRPRQEDDEEDDGTESDSGGEGPKPAPVPLVPSSSSSPVPVPAAAVAVAVAAAGGAGGVAPRQLKTGDRADVLSTRRAETARSVQRTMLRFHKILVDQRAMYEQYAPEQVVSEEVSQADRDAATARLQEAYATLDAQISEMGRTAHQIRKLEKIVNPLEFSKPVVIGLASSAPCSTFATFVWSETDVPLPGLKNRINEIFQHFYTNADKNENRLKRPRYNASTK